MKFGVQWDSKGATNGNTEKLDNQINLELRPKTNVKEELALSMEYNSVKIFDGWFYFSEDLQKVVKQYFPLALNYKIDNLMKHQQTIKRYLHSKTKSTTNDKTLQTRIIRIHSLPYCNSNSILCIQMPSE